MKFQRKFFMQVQGMNKLWTFTSPLTVELSIERGIYQTIADGTFVIKNLAESTRRDLYLDWFNQQLPPRNLLFYAGYESWLPSTVAPSQYPSFFPLIFNGQLKSAQSHRAGCDWNTELVAWDAGQTIAQAWASFSWTVGTSYSKIINDLLGELKLKLQYAPPWLLDLTLQGRGKSFIGSPFMALQSIARTANCDFWLDLSLAFITPKGQSVPSLVSGLGEITSETGLLNTPTKQQYMLSFEMIFEPRVVVGQTLELSSLETITDGSYSVGGISHNGVISDAVDTGCTTKITCAYPPAFPVGLPGGVGVQS